jgi:hypothetical protein
MLPKSRRGSHYRAAASSVVTRFASLAIASCATAKADSSSDKRRSIPVGWSPALSGTCAVSPSLARRQVKPTRVRTRTASMLVKRRRSDLGPDWHDRLAPIRRKRQLIAELERLFGKKVLLQEEAA